jgi:hypothetical protein
MPRYVQILPVNLLNTVATTRRVAGYWTPMLARYSKPIDIGQVRRDTALFGLPAPGVPGTRGRRRLYGEKISADAIAGLPVSIHRIAGYGGRAARLRHLVCRPRFLRGVIVRAVWCELEKRGGWARQRLLLSTDPALSAPAIVEAYSNRWSTEPLSTPSSSPTAWARCGSAAAPPCCAGCTSSRSAAPFWSCSPPRPSRRSSRWSGGWRKAATLTPGLVKDALAHRFRNLQAFRLVPATGRKSGPVRSTGPPRETIAA